VEKLEESTHGTIFTGGTQFGKTGSKTFWSILRHQAKFFGGKTLSLWCSTIPCYSTHKDISNGTRSTSIEVSYAKVMPLRS